MNAAEKQPVEVDEKIMEQSGIPSTEQLWNAIEFSRRFPDLILHMVSDQQAAAQLRSKKKKRNDEDGLEFPQLTVPDLRRFVHKRKKQDCRQAEIDAFFDSIMPLRNDAPPADATSLPPAPKRTKSIWVYLLTAVFLFSLLWFCAESMSGSIFSAIASL